MIMLDKQRKISEIVNSLPTLDGNESVLALRIRPTLYVFNRELIVIPLHKSETQKILEAQKYLYKALAFYNDTNITDENIRKTLGEKGIFVGCDDITKAEELNTSAWKITENKVKLK